MVYGTLKPYSMKRQSPTFQKPAGAPLRAARPAVSSAREPASANTHGVIDLTEQNLEAAIDGHPFAVIDFRAPASAASREFAPALAAAAARHPDILFARVDAEEQRGIVAQFNIRSIPTLIVFRSNIIVYAKPGGLPAAALEQMLGEVRALDMQQVRRKVVSIDAIAVGDAAAPATHGRALTDAEARHPSIENHLRPSVRAALADAGPRLASGGLIAVRDAFDADFAEQMHRSLDSCRTWRLYERYEDNFHFHHHNLFNAEEFPADLARCAEVFDSAGTKAWVTRLSGRHCPGPTEFSASLFLPGDHSLPHNDVAAVDGGLNRQVAWVWHLAKDWRPEWGGALYWCSRSSYLPPAFNTLYLFNVSPDSNHFVTRVSPYAQGKRLAVNGWWTGPAATGNPARQDAQRIAAVDNDILVY